MYDCTGRLISEKKKKNISNIQACSEQVTKLRCVICYWDRLDALPRRRNFPGAPSFHFSSLWIWIFFAAELEQLLNIHHGPPFFRCQDGAWRRVAAEQEQEQAWCSLGIPTEIAANTEMVCHPGRSGIFMSFSTLGLICARFLSLYFLSLPTHPGGIMDFSIYSVKT